MQAMLAVAAVVLVLGATRAQYSREYNDYNSYCHARDQDAYWKMGTKTSYQFVYDKQSKQHIIPDCSPIYLWSLNRHGTRYPDEKTIEGMRTLANVQRTILEYDKSAPSSINEGSMLRLCQEDLDLLRRWQFNASIERHPRELTPQGVMELGFLARRYAARFSLLLSKPYNDRTFKFQYTASDRTHDSYQAFIEGLFREQAFEAHANVFANDKLIKPTDFCPRWQEDVDLNPDMKNEYRNFKRSQIYQDMVREVSQRLGFRYTLTDATIKTMYDMCRYEKAWKISSNYDKIAPWCAAFKREHLKVLEYAEDLKYYYEGGYGNELNRRVGCPLVKDLYERVEKIIQGTSDGTEASFYFTHSITILTVLSAFGFMKDDVPLTADNYYSQNNRKWKTSELDPFAANLVAALYRCRSGDQYRIMFFLNEKPINDPDCSVGLCNWFTFKDRLKAISDNCNIEEICNGANMALHTTYIIHIAALLIIFFSYFTR